MEYVTVGVISPSITTWPLYAGQGLGFFEDSGTSVSIEVTYASQPHMAGLLGAKFDIGHQLADHVIRAATSRQDVVGFLAIDRPVAHLMVNEEVTKFEDLRGKTLAVDSTSTGYALLLRQILRANRLDPERDIVLEAIGGTQQRLSALRDGAVAATILEAPNCFVAAESGLRELAVSTDYVANYQGTVEACLSDWGANHSDLLVHYLRGVVRAMDWLQDPSNREPALGMLCNHLGVSIAAASAAYDEQVQGGRFNRRGHLEAQDMNELMRLMRAEGETLVLASEEEFWDGSYLERADPSGAIS